MSVFKLRAKLLEAVIEGNLKEVKDKLSLITAVDDFVRDELGLLLHHERITPDIAKELLAFGANVRKFNGLRDTPLHSAIVHHKEPELIELFLKFGASTDSSNYRGNTPLYVALKKKNRNLKVIQLLLEFGADISILNRERRVNGNHFSSLQYSMYNLECVYLLVKLTLFRYFKSNYKEKLDMDSLKGFKNFTHVSKFFDDCVYEINEMNRDMMCKDICLYELVSSECIIEHFTLQNIYDFADTVILRIVQCTYPIYQDLILTSKIVRKVFLHKVNNLQFYTVINGKSKVSLNRESTLEIVKYLSNNDLLNFMLAFSNVVSDIAQTW